MNNSNRFTLSGRIRSFRFAFIGIAEMIKTQHNARVHLVASITVIAAGISLNISNVEWCFLILAIFSVWVAEALNTAFELLCDVASPEFHPLVKKSKDVAAGAVLLSAIGTVCIGLVIFIPYLQNYI
ncbi:diacylglycerol kinase family protein [Rhodohalobacter sp. 614A]|uniref:diacylglycerol kinase family protein n=1 Tax=Rhodohalobacter sp. 614A TaxID=2908649 RepID=UPI001F306F4A|nr:diacylglycerol kinase family protein [Rhodohalobacter sp. 614A]